MIPKAPCRQSWCSLRQSRRLQTLPAAALETLPCASHVLQGGRQLSEGGGQGKSSPVCFSCPLDHGGLLFHLCQPLPSVLPFCSALEHLCNFPGVFLSSFPLIGVLWIQLQVLSRTFLSWRGTGDRTGSSAGAPCPSQGISL